MFLDNVVNGYMPTHIEIDALLGTLKLCKTGLYGAGDTSNVCVRCLTLPLHLEGRIKIHLASQFIQASTLHGISLVHHGPAAKHAAKSTEAG